MKRVGVLLMVLLAGCGGADPIAPANAWVGTWTLESVDGVTVPASTIILGYQQRVVSRVLELRVDDFSHWQDSTLSALHCIPVSPKGPGMPMCNASGSAYVTWDVDGDKLTVVRRSDLTLGYVVTLKTFIRQEDGSLLKTDDSQVERYRKS